MSTILNWIDNEKLKFHKFLLTLNLFSIATVNVVNAYILKHNRAPRLKINLVHHNATMHHGDRESLKPRVNRV